MTDSQKPIFASTNENFATGAKRGSQEGKCRPDLTSPFATERKGWINAHGAVNYGDRNWEKGMPFSRVLASIERHLMGYKQGDTSEDHLAQLGWNVDALLHFEEVIKLGLLPSSLNDLPFYKQKAIAYDTNDATNAEIIRQIREGTLEISVDRASRMHLNEDGKIVVSPIIDAADLAGGESAIDRATRLHGSYLADLNKLGIRHLCGMPFTYAHQPPHVQTLMDELADSSDPAPEAYETETGGWVHGFTGGEHGVKYSHPVGADISIDPSQEAKWTNHADFYVSRNDPVDFAFPFLGIPIDYSPDLGENTIIAISTDLLDRTKVLVFGTGDKQKKIVAYEGEAPTKEEVQFLLSTPFFFPTVEITDFDPEIVYPQIATATEATISILGEIERAKAHTFKPIDRTPLFVTMLAELLYTQGVSSEVAEQILKGTTYHPFTINPTGYVYVAGPMRGYPEYNFPAFDAARDRLQEAGFVVTSPADIDRVADGQDVTSKPVQDAKVYAYRDFSTLLMIAYTGQGYIAMLPGWEKSTGATAEFFLARWLGITVLDAETLLPLDRVDPGSLGMSIVAFLDQNRSK